MPAKHAQSLQQTYAQVAQGYEKVHSSNRDVETLEVFFNLLPNKKGTILDLGAGNGRDSGWFIDKGLEVTMFDLSPEMLEIAQRKNPKAKAVQGEAQPVVQRVYDMLKDKGVFYCLLKKGEGEQEVEDDKYGKSMKRFFAFYSAAELRDLVRSVGFKVVQSKQSVSPSGMEWVEAWAVKE